MISWLTTFENSSSIYFDGYRDFSATDFCFDIYHIDDVYLEDHADGQNSIDFS